MLSHHLIRSGLLAPRSNIYQLTHQMPIMHFILSKSKTALHFDRICIHTDQGCYQQADWSKMAAVRSNLNNLLGRSEHLILSSSTKTLQPSTKFSSSSFKYNENSNYGGNGNVSSSNKSLFDFFNLRSLMSTPSPFMLYGIGGLIPFTSVPFLILMTSAYYPLLAHAQLVYGACILSFLGGVAWGNELKAPETSTLKSLAYSISLPLIGWLGVLVYPSIIAFPIMISGVSFAGYIDTQLQNYPQWFKNLRFLLSSLVAASLLATFLFSLIYPDSESKKSLTNS